jgi:hypothetical protein
MPSNISRRDYTTSSLLEEPWMWGLARALTCQTPYIHAFAGDRSKRERGIWKAAPSAKLIWAT